MTLKLSLPRGRAVLLVAVGLAVVGGGINGVGIAADAAATPAERQAAYRKARQELDGLIDVPNAAAAQIEQRIAGELER